jgi:hypothetical protein
VTAVAVQTVSAGAATAHVLGQALVGRGRPGPILRASWGGRARPCRSGQRGRHGRGARVEAGRLAAGLLIALLAGRLLGVSRSLVTTALAGAAGWLSPLALSLAIAEGDPGAAGLWTAGVGVRGSRSGERN